MNLNIQIVGTGIHEAAARSGLDGLRATWIIDRRGTTRPCYICNGKGMVGTDTCRTCGGQKETRQIEVVRLDTTPTCPEPIRQWVNECTQNGFHVNVCIRAAETGGGYTNTGRATIICGVGGEPLPAKKGQRIVNGEHAVFYTPQCIQVVIHRHHGQYRGRADYLTTTLPDLSIHSQTIWEWSNENEPSKILNTPNIPFPGDAAAAALRKSYHYHCRCAYYTASAKGGPHENGPEPG